jgi:hypothetical protein
VQGAYRVALLCGGFPLLVGVSVFLLWLATRADELMMAGVFVLFGGLACFAVGVLALARYCWLAFRAPELPRRFWIATIACAALLLSNFPAAGVIMYAAEAIFSRYTVVIRNDSDRSVEDVEVSGNGRLYFSTDSILPGDVVEGSFRLHHEGGLDLHARTGAAALSKEIDGYCIDGCHTIVTIRPGGAVSAVQRFRD